MKLGVTAVMLPELDFAEQIDLCRSLNVKYYQYRPRVIADNQRDAPYSNWGNHKFDLTPKRLAKDGAVLTKQLRDNGMEPWGTVPTVAVDADDDEIKLNVEGAVVADAKAMRCRPPAYGEGVFDYAELLKRVVDRYAYVIDTISGPAGIKLIMETHCGSFVTSAALAWNVCKDFSPGHIGVIFDLANMGREGRVKENLAVSVLGDYIDCCHVGGSRLIIDTIDEFGAKVPTYQSCAAAESDLHLPSYVKALHNAGLTPPLVIENYTPNVPGSDRLTETATFLHRVLETL